MIMTTTTQKLIGRMVASSSPFPAGLGVLVGVEVEPLGQYSTASQLFEMKCIAFCSTVLYSLGSGTLALSEACTHIDGLQYSSCVL